MQFLSSLFGGSGNTAVTAVLALAVVLVLIVLVAWLLKFISKASGNAVRGRQRRLSVIDTLAVDQKRQLLIIRRDDVEHLILIGGAQDLVVETGIPVLEAAPSQSPRRGFATPAARRPTPAPTPSIPATPVESEPAPSPAPTITAAPGTVLEQLQRAGHPTDKKGHVSLRHTGLLRPVRNQDAAEDSQITDNSKVNGVDSGKESVDTDLSGNATLENNTSPDANRS